MANNVGQMEVDEEETQGPVSSTSKDRKRFEVKKVKRKKIR
jgi:hypothetical protein